MNQQAVHLNDVPNHVPGSPSVRTVWRWADTGVKGVRLETFKVGHRRYTTTEAIQRFCDQVTENAEKSRLETITRRKRELERLEQELDAEGL